jgi:hypothetical protein
MAPKVPTYFGSFRVLRARDADGTALAVSNDERCDIKDGRLCNFEDELYSNLEDEQLCYVRRRTRLRHQKISDDTTSEGKQ